MTGVDLSLQIICAAMCCAQHVAIVTVRLCVKNMIVAPTIDCHIPGPSRSMINPHKLISGNLK